jgi:hypothetical protein
MFTELNTKELAGASGKIHMILQEIRKATLDDTTTTVEDLNKVIAIPSAYRRLNSTDIEDSLTHRKGKIYYIFIDCTNAFYLLDRDMILKKLEMVPDCSNALKYIIKNLQ